MVKYLTKKQTLTRMRFTSDRPERFENYAAFRSDGAKVRLRTMRMLEDEGHTIRAKPSIGAPWTLPVEGEVA